MPAVCGDKTEAELVTADLDHMVFRYRKETYTIHLAGSHQLENAVLALAGIRALQDTGYQISGEQIRSGMEKSTMEWSIYHSEKRPLSGSRWCT